MSRIRVVPLPGVEETKKGSDKDAGVAYWKAHAVDADFNSRTSGWKWSTDHNKIGIVPKSKVGAELTLQVPHQPLPSSASPLRTVTIFYMKSYGLKWDGSTIKVEVLEPIEGASKGPDSASWTVLQSLDLNGFHAKNTSETYTETIHLKDRQATSLRQLRIRLSVIAGSTFKITGLLACR